MATTQPIMEVDDLKKYFTRSSMIDSLLRRESAPIKAVDDISLKLQENQVQGVIGESGCGKTTLLRTLIGLYSITEGSIKFNGTDIRDYEGGLKGYRRNVQIIFQDPYNSLDPKMTVMESLREPLNIHDMEASYDRFVEVLNQVELRPAERYLDSYPEQLSGGELQRASIARALIVEPDVILADEPVSMLDVSTQAAVLNLLRDLVDEYGLSMFYISHDLSTVSQICDVINVMYLGRIIETAPTLELIEEPKHPYSQALINAIPVPDPYSNRNLTSLEGSTPSPEEVGTGCRFKGRCPERMDICEKAPEDIQIDSERTVACHLYNDEEVMIHE